MNNSLRKLWQTLQIQSGVEALAAALFTLVTTAGTIWLCKDLLYGVMPVYEELVVGGTTWDAYNKQGDLTMFYLIFFLVPVYFVLFLYLKHSLQKTKSTTVSRSENLELCKPCVKEWRLKVIFSLFLGIESVRALQTALIGQFPQRQSQINVIALAFVFIWVIYVCVLVIKDKEKTDKLLVVAQMGLALQFLGYYKFYYCYEAEAGVIQLFYSGKWKWMCLLLCVTFFGWQLYEIFKKRTDIYVPSLILVAIGRAVQGPEGLLSVDFFHNGEMSMPMQQLMSYGKLPYFDMDPIHGLCDYFYSAINYIWFDGTYFSQQVAIFVAGIFMAVLMALVMGICFENRYAAFAIVYLFMPFLVQKAGVRYVLFFTAFIILFSKKVRKDSFRFLWWWVLLCMLSIFWNVSIGSSMAVAFLPEVLYRVVKDIIPRLRQFKEWERGSKKKFLISYGLLFIAGVCYIPWFLQILRFLSENAGTTLYVNGTAIFGDEFRFISTFGILIPYVAILIYALCNGKEGTSAFVTMFSCMMVISNYACVRYDEGARLAVLAVFFMLIFAVRLLDDGDMNCHIRNGILAVFALLSLWFIRYDISFVKPYIEVADIPASKEVTIMGEEVNDPVVFVSGDSVGMPQLGTGFIQGNTLNSLKNIKAVLDAELTDESYMDLTNKISHYVIMDKESVLPFTSAYNISNAKMQKKAIELVKEEQPRLIMIAPLIQFDLAPVSLRSMEFYESLMEMGYKPYVYQDVVYLLNGESTFAEAAGEAIGQKSLGDYCHKEYLGALPYIWGMNWEEQSESILYEQSASNVTIRPREGVIRGSQVSYVLIKTSGLTKEEGIWTFQFLSDVDGQTYQFQIERMPSKAEEGSYLIPVGSSPFWYYSDIEEIVIKGQTEDIEHIALY